LPQKAVTAYHRDRLSANYRFVYSRRFANLSRTLTIPKAEFTVAFSHRRNLKRLTAAKTVTAYHRDRLSANYRFVYSRRFTILQIAQTIPKAELSAATRRTAVSPS
jgi:hypothetical protein